MSNEGAMSLDHESDDSSLRDKAGEAIRAGKLPNCSPDRVWGLRGGGAKCPICGVSMKHDELGLNIEFKSRDGPRPRSYRIHIRCYSALEFQLRAATGTTLPNA